MDTANANKTSRRDLLKSGGVAGASILAAPYILSSKAWAQKEPVRVAVVQDMSKTYGLIGDLHAKGLKMAFDEAGNEVMGRKIELVIEDTGGDAAVTLSKTKKVLSTFKPHFFTGPIASSNYAAIKDEMFRSKAIWLLLTQGAGAEDTVLPICNRNAFSVSWNNWQLSAPFADWAYKNIAKEFWTGYADYNWGQGAAAVFKEQFEKNGGKITGSIAPPLGTSDYSPYLSKVLAAKPPGIFCFFAGGDAVNFVKQWHQFGLHKVTKLTGQGFMIEEEVLPAQGEAAVGTISILSWARTLNNPANKAFTEKFMAAYKTPPAVFAMCAHDAGRVMMAAVKSAKSTDTNGLIKAIETMSIDSPRGNLKFDPVTHEATQTFYVRETKMVNGQPSNVVIAALPTIPTPAKACRLNA